MTFRTPYARYDVLQKRDSPSWDDVTRKVVDARLHELPPRRFFREDEWDTLQAVCARLLPQPERGADVVPIAPWIDDKLYHDRGDGYRYEDLPPRQEAWRRALRGLDEAAQARGVAKFIALDAATQDALLLELQRGEITGAAWRGMSAKRFFASMLMSDVLSFYYAHPAAWSEIGFGGPASPRGYARRDANQRDPWEAEADE
jgi:hypothetical protein